MKRLRRRQFDPVITKRTIDPVLGPFTALYRLFLKRGTNKAVGAISRALFKPPQRRQGPDPRPLWLVVGTPSAFGPERTDSLLKWTSIHIFAILLYYYTCLCTTFLWPLHFGWLLVLSLYKGGYLQISNACPFDYTAVAVVGRFGTRKQI